jgi:uncharacterized protein with HEPN domain
MRRETAKRLLDAELACVEARELCAGVTRDQFLQSRVVQLAVQKLVEIVGEALRQAEESDADAVRSIPELRAVVNTRNRLVHGYDSVDFGAVWDIVQRHVPELQERLHSLLIPFPPSHFGAVPDDVSD